MVMVHKRAMPRRRENFDFIPLLYLLIALPGLVETPIYRREGRIYSPKISGSTHWIVSYISRCNSCMPIVAREQSSLVRSLVRIPVIFSREVHLHFRDFGIPLDRNCPLPLLFCPSFTNCSTGLISERS